MDQSEVVRLISQYLSENGLTTTLDELKKESGRNFSSPRDVRKDDELQTILDEFVRREESKKAVTTSVKHLFSPGKDEYANTMWCSFVGICDGVNLLVVKLMENGVLVFSAAKSQLGTLQLPLPLIDESPPIAPIPTMYPISTSSILCVNIHPFKRNVLLCGSMDRHSYILDLELENEENGILQKFKDHSKYVVRAQWAPSGKFFVSGSYDHSICVYRSCSVEDKEDQFELVERIEVNGSVEGMAFAKSTDEFIVGVRSDHFLHCYDLSSGKPIETRQINLNSFGDDFVSFVPMHISFSPDGKYFLVSTDANRLILYSWGTGKQIANLYGASNDELSQPRHCWDPTGNYIYGTSQDYSICVWEIRNQTLVARLIGHTSTVRNLHFCADLGVLVSCAFDGIIKLWKRTTSES